MMRSRAAHLVLAALLLGAAACGDDDSSDRPGESGTTGDEVVLDDVVLRNDEVPASFEADEGDPPDRLLGPLCEGREEGDLVSAEEVVVADFAVADTDVYLDSTVVRVAAGEGATQLDEYRTEAERCGAERSIDVEEVTGIGDEALHMTQIHDDDGWEGVERWVGRVDDVVVQVTLHWVVVDPTEVDALGVDGEALLAASIGRA